MAQIDNIARVLTVADSCDFITAYQDELTAAERANIVQPVELARVVFRRKLGKLFKGHEVRKNITNYSIKYMDPDISKLINLHYILRTGVQSYFRQRFTAEFSQNIEALIGVLDAFQNAHGITFRVRDSESAFFYVTYTPFTVGNGEAQTFASRSLRARMRSAEELATALARIEFTSAARKLEQFFTMHGYWNFGNLSSSIARGINGALDESFLDFALQSPRGLPMGEIVQRYISAKNAVPSVTSAAPVQSAPTPAVEPEPRPAVHAEVRRPTPQEIFRQALQRASDRTGLRTPEHPMAQEPEPVPATPPSAGTNPNQALFDQTLSRIISRPSSDPSDMRFMTLRKQFEQDPFEIFKYYQRTRRTDPPILSVGTLNNRTSRDHYYALTRLMKTYPMPTGIKTTAVDVEDDHDDFHDGLYFYLEDSRIVYKVYKANELLHSSSDYNSAAAACVKHHGTLLTVRYSEV